jgi:hypothetical protein
VDRLIRAEKIKEPRDLRSARDANLRRALRTATPRAAERIQLEIDTVAHELSQAEARLERLEEVQQPMRITPKLIRDTIDEMSGLIEHAGLDTRVAWGSVTCSSGSASTAATSMRWLSGRPPVPRVLTARIQ